MVQAILRNERRAGNIINAIRAGLHGYANSTRGEKSLGVKCSITIDYNTVIVKCKDGTIFKIGLK